MSKILFLDIDGVVNSRATTNFRQLYPIDQYMAFMVGKIQLDTGCDVVLSSSWRNHPDGVVAVEKQIVKIIDVTPNLGGGLSVEDCGRGKEVQAWLDQHQEVTKHAILDDDSDFFKHQPLFKTTFTHGLTEEIAKRVTDYLNDVPFHDPWCCLMCRNKGMMCIFHQRMELDGYKPPKSFAGLL